MHVLLALSTTLLVVLGGLGLLRAAHRSASHPRRLLQGLVLAIPLAALAFGVAVFHHFAGRACVLGAPLWDVMLAKTVPVGAGLVALGGLGLGLARHALLGRAIARGGQAPAPELCTLADALARGFGVRRPRLLVCALDRPLALTYGLRRPTVLLSSWMVERLDQRELEAVLAHELAHAARRDYLFGWLATSLRDAFFYLPASWAAWRQLQWDREPACDDLAVAATRRPLALASALAKVWHHAVAGPTVAPAPALLGGESPVESRIQRLLDDRAARAASARPTTLALAAAGLAGLAGLQLASLALLLASMGCGPLAGGGVAL